MAYASYSAVNMDARMCQFMFTVRDHLQFTAQSASLMTVPCKFS